VGVGGGRGEGRECGGGVIGERGEGGGWGGGGGGGGGRKARYLRPMHVYFCKIKIEARRKYANHILAPKIEMILENVFYPKHKII